MTNEFIERHAKAGVVSTPPPPIVMPTSKMVLPRLSSGRGSGKTYTMMQSAVALQQHLGGTVYIICRDHSMVPYMMDAWSREDGRVLYRVGSREFRYRDSTGEEELVAMFMADADSRVYPLGLAGPARPTGIFYDNSVTETYR